MLPGSPPKPSPAASFLQNYGLPQRSLSFSAGSPSPAPNGDEAAADHGGGDRAGAGTAIPPPHHDLRRAVSMKAAGAARPPWDLGRLPSLGMASNDLANNGSPNKTRGSPTLSPAAAAARSAFFPQANNSVGRTTSPSSVFTDDEPTSPTDSNASSGAFSPASAFLSHFSSTSSVRGAEKPLLPDQQGARVLDYTLGKVIGRGGFSTVRQAIHVKTGEILACKIVKRDDLSDTSGSLERLEDEIRIWHELPNHRNLMPLLEMKRTEYATFLLMPYLSGGSLLDVIRRETGGEQTARKWFPGVVASVTALHEGFDGFEGGMLHGDLKLDNFIVDGTGVIRLSDFGMAQKVGSAVPTIPPSMSAQSHLPSHMQQRGRISSAPSPTDGSRPSSRSPARQTKGQHDNEVVPCASQPFPSASLPYAPPELLRAPPARPTLAQDIWAIGVILYALLTRRLPFVDAFDPRLQLKILRGQYETPMWVGQEWLEVLQGCLDHNVATRWDIKRVRESDAVVGWREVKPRIKSRSRSRARHPGQERDRDLVYRGGEGRDRDNQVSGRGRSRSRLRDAVHGHHRAASYASPGTTTAGTSPHDSEARDRTSLHVPGSHPSTPQTDYSRSRSASRNRKQVAGTPGVSHVPRPALTINADVNPMGGRAGRRGSTEDRLSADLDSVSITRGRSSQRGPGPKIYTPDGSPSLRHHGATMAAGPDERASRSRTRWSDVARDVAGRDGRTPPSSTPPRSRSRHSASHSPAAPGGWQIVVLNDATAPPLTSGPGSRPPTLGFELDVVDEEGKRGRSPSQGEGAAAEITQFRQSVHSDGHAHGRAQGERGPGIQVVHGLPGLEESVERTHTHPHHAHHRPLQPHYHHLHEHAHHPLLQQNGQHSQPDEEAPRGRGRSPARRPNEGYAAVAARSLSRHRDT